MTGSDKTLPVADGFRDYKNDCKAMETILDLLGQVTEKETVDDITRAIVEGVRDKLGFDRVGLFLWESGFFRGTYGTNPNGETTDEHNLSWEGKGWAPMKQIKRGITFIEVELDQPPPRPGEEQIKAYLVVLKFGQKLYGVISVDNRISRRPVTDRELRYLTLFSRILGNVMDISKIMAQLDKNNKQFERELELAQTIQLGFLPKRFPRHDKIAFHSFYQPCTFLGGDLFDVFVIDDDHLGMYIADVAGHGVSAALISGLLKMAVVSVREHHGTASHTDGLLHPDVALATLNDMLAKELPEDEFITLLFAVFEVSTYTFGVATAGHIPPLVFNAATRKIVSWEIPRRPPLGLIPGTEYPVVTHKIERGDKILFYTDGLTEALNARGEEFGLEQLTDVFGKVIDQNPAGISKVIKEAVDRFRAGHEISDDFTMLVAEIR